MSIVLFSAGQLAVTVGSREKGKGEGAARQAGARKSSKQWGREHNGESEQGEQSKFSLRVTVCKERRLLKVSFYRCATFKTSSSLVVTNWRLTA